MKSIAIKPEEVVARAYADRLILERLTELQSAIKLSDLAERLQGTGIGLAAIRSLLASNPSMFAYAERRWVPAARIEGQQRPFHEALRLLVDRYGGPMPLRLVLGELSLLRNQEVEELEPMVRRSCEIGDLFFMTRRQEIGLASWVFEATDERFERALALNGVTEEEVAEVEAKLGDFDWRAPDAVARALEKVAPVSLRTLGAAAYRVLSPDDPRSILLFNWRSFAAEALSLDGFVYAADGVLHPESHAKTWISAAVKLAERIAPTVEIEDAAPIEIKPDDVNRIAKRILSSDESTTATRLLEEFYEITPSVKTFPDDMANLMAALQARDDVWWVGGDRFRKPGSAPELIDVVPEPFHFVTPEHLDETGDPIDFELTDDGLSTSLRKLLQHPLATDVLDEDIMPAPKAKAEQLRLVLKPIHRELGTFPLCQFPTGWLDPEPRIQELLFIDSTGRELQAWANMEARLIFNLIDWWFEQPVESGAVFSLTRTPKPNVFEFAWFDQPDPVVYISNQRMEELREIASRLSEASTLEILREVMQHWPKGADFLTILWEINVVRRTSRRMVASLLSSYQSFYQRQGSPVWHYDAKKVDQGVDKTKKKFIKK